MEGYHGRCGLYELLAIPNHDCHWQQLDSYLLCSLEELARQAIEEGLTTEEEVLRGGSTMIWSQVLHEATKRGSWYRYSCVQSGTVFWRLKADVAPTEYHLSDEDMLRFITDYSMYYIGYFDVL